MMGLSTSGSISLGWALVAGRKRVPSPAAGNTALRTLIAINDSDSQLKVRWLCRPWSELQIVPDCERWPTRLWKPDDGVSFRVGDSQQRKEARHCPECYRTVKTGSQPRRSRTKQQSSNYN